MTTTLKPNNEVEDWGYLYGFQMREAEIGVNIEKLWKDTKGRGKKKELNFIENFAKVYLHEELHRQIFYSLLEIYEPQEELIVDSMSGSDKLEVRE